MKIIEASANPVRVDTHNTYKAVVKIEDDGKFYIGNSQNGDPTKAVHVALHDAVTQRAKELHDKLNVTHTVSF